MAPRLEVDLRTAIRLEALLANVADLPEVAEEWPELPDGERVSWSLDWDQLMLSCLPHVHLVYRTGRVTPKHRGRSIASCLASCEMHSLRNRQLLNSEPKPLNQIDLIAEGRVWKTAE